MSFSDYLMKLPSISSLNRINFLLNLSYRSFLTTSLSTTSFNFLKSTGVASNLPISSLSISDFKLPKLTFLGNLDLSKSVAISKSMFVA